MIERLKPIPFAFWKSAAGREPVRDWLNELPRLRVEGETFEAFRQKVADATADLLSEDGDGDIRIEIVAHASVRARAVA